MKTKYTIAFLILLCISCSKEKMLQQAQVSDQNDAATAAKTTKVPLNDLGKGTYLGYVGGLYPGGANKPPTRYGFDLMQISKSIVPIDTFGNALDNGKIVFISLGASIGGKNMKAMITKTAGNPVTNPKLLLFNCNEGGKYSALSNIMNPNDSYWLHVSEVIASQKSSYKQVQIVYLETDDGIVTKQFPDRPNQVKTKIEACARTIKQKFVNAKVLYLLGRTRTFNDASNNATPWNTEPSPYYFGWACKWAIEDQIKGISGTEYKGSNKVAPIMAWGFYQWADSLPRKTDDFYWRASETKDGLHSNDDGEDTLATRFQNFLLTNSYSRLWYANN